MGALTGGRQDQGMWAVQQGARAAKCNVLSSLTPNDSLARAAAGAAPGTGTEWEINRADTEAGRGKALQEH